VSAVRSVAAPGEPELAAAREAVAARLAPTPLVRAPGLGDGVWLKLESLHPTGSFKVRGALAALSALDPGEAVVTASAGNHGLGVAWAATALGRRATVVVPVNASPAKLAALERFDVALERVGASYDDAEARALALAERGAVYVSPYNDPRVIAGQATIGAEIDLALGSPSGLTVVAPLGGGGLASGLGLWSSGRPGGRARVVAVEAERSQAFRTALDAGRITPFAASPTLADGLGGNIEPGSVTFELVRDHVDAVLFSPEPEIEDAVRVLASVAGVVAEGAAACAAAAVLADRARPEAGAPLVLVVTGRNIARARLAEILAA
jgi:threonine dehydratase